MHVLLPSAIHLLGERVLDVDDALNLRLTVSSLFSRSLNHDLAKALRTDATLVPPIRQTASIFKQPVTVRTPKVDWCPQWETEKKVISLIPEANFLKLV
jgi:hypothetical protein